MPNGVKYAPTFCQTCLMLATNPTTVKSFEPDCRNVIFLHPWKLSGVTSLEPVEADDVSGGTILYAYKVILLGLD